MRATCPDLVGVTETSATVVVQASVLSVCRYLNDVANIGHCLPGVRAVRTGEDQTLTLRYDGAVARTARIAPGRFRIDRLRQRVDWEIDGTAYYSGTIGIYGDSTISQLQSILRTDQPSLSGPTQDLHIQMLRRIARGVEDGLELAPAPAPADDPRPTTAAARLSVLSSLPDPGNLPGDSAAVADKQGVTRGL